MNSSKAGRSTGLTQADSRECPWRWLARFRPTWVAIVLGGLLTVSQADILAQSEVPANEGAPGSPLPMVPKEEDPVIQSAVREAPAPPAGNFQLAAAAGSNVPAWVRSQVPRYLERYRLLHAAPELSNQERQTSALVAKWWRELGAEVTEGVGGFGVVALIRNGPGPTLLLRTDMDALPVTEETGLTYASRVQATGTDGKPCGVMHACGHDMHMSCVTGALQYLAEHRSNWQGTLMVVGQPAEERGTGARAMLADKLFERFAKPDVGIALHCSPELATGTVGLTSGHAMANVDSVDITIKGRGGHGAYPHTAIDPVVIAARLILDLQTIVSRELNPQDPAVITVGAIEGGTKHNIIPESCHLQLTIRSYTDDVRKALKEAVVRKANAAAQSSGAPLPSITFSEGTDALHNDPALAEEVRQILTAALGEKEVIVKRPSMGGEDFSAFGRAGIPICMFWLGTVPPERIARAAKLGEPLPPLHSPKYYPDAEPSLQLGITSLATVCLHKLPLAETAPAAAAVGGASAPDSAAATPTK